MNFNLDLPFDYILKAYIQTSTETHYVLVYRDHDHTPYVVYRVGQDLRSCAWGDYCETRAEAERCLIARTQMGGPK